jgi:hypothetical protein
MFYIIILSPAGDSEMTKLINEPIRVHEKEGSDVDAFIWRRRLYRITDVISQWREPADWWNGKAVRLFVRVIALSSSPGTYELYKLGGEWFLSRVLD